MNILNVTEYAAVTNSGDGVEPAVVSKSVPFDQVGTVSDTFSDRTLFVRLVASTDCRVAFGNNPEVKEDSMIIPSGIPQYFGVQKLNKLAVVKL